MKKLYILFLLFSVVKVNTFAQGNVGIGTNTPDNSAILDISSSDKGLLIPRVSIATVNTFGLSGATSTAGMLVYNTNASVTGGQGTGYYFWNGSKWLHLLNDGNIKANNGLSVNNDTVQLGGTLTKKTVIQDNGNDFAIDGTGNVGIGYSAPSYKLTVNGTIQAIDFGTAGTPNIIIGDDAFFTDVDQGNIIGLYGLGNNAVGGLRLGSNTESLVWGEGGNIRIGNTAGTPKEKLHVQGNILANNNVLAGQGIVTGKIQRMVGPGTGADNTWHTVELDNGYGGTAISAVATGSYLDGEIRIQGIDISDLLSATTGWYTTNTANVWNSVSVLKDASSGLTGDGRAYMVYCPNDYIATGWQVWANSQLDHYLKLKCTKLKDAYGTVESGEGIESVQSFPRNTADNINHVSVCPAGTFVKGLSIYANTYLDGNLTVNCTGIKLK